MKSIKEKSKEWADMYPSCGMADKSFEAGADYVLDIIEECLEEPSMIQGYSDIMAVVQELKGE